MCCAEKSEPRPPGRDKTKSATEKGSGGEVPEAAVAWGILEKGCRAAMERGDEVTTVF